jgi:hypothetical protein
MTIAGSDDGRDIRLENRSVRTLCWLSGLTALAGVAACPWYLTVEESGRIQMGIGPEAGSRFRFLSSDWPRWESGLSSRAGLAGVATLILEVMALISFVVGDSGVMTFGLARRRWFDLARTGYACAIGFTLIEAVAQVPFASVPAVGEANRAIGMGWGVPVTIGASVAAFLGNTVRSMGCAGRAPLHRQSTRSTGDSTRTT